MRQYKELLLAIKEKGTVKPPARENMPSTISLFGYQLRHNLQEGFPLLTTKKLSFKNIVVELVWFLKGETNIKFLVDNGCNIWNEDAYNYYVKIASKNTGSDANSIYFNNGDGTLRMFTFDEFVLIIRMYEKTDQHYDFNKLPKYGNYTLGDCGKQYGWLWRKWDKSVIAEDSLTGEKFIHNIKVDQIADLIQGLRNNPLGRRHILTAWNPATLDDMALNACHAFVQFNCRPIEYFEGDGIAFGEVGNFYRWVIKPNKDCSNDFWFESVEASSIEEIIDNPKFPSYYLDCHLYQRSADVFLGVPYNIASYALLVHLLAIVCNMQVGDLVHSFGDVHIYENHMDAVNEQLTREERELPKLNINTEFWLTESGECGVGLINIDWFISSLNNDAFINSLIQEDIQLSNYNPHPSIKAKLSTGLVKS